ncbi:MAG: epoxyqueuosine reductase [Proteobacteria bacterium]|nr:epoxyqueuosine reductase [Pseudomonadota bacterium]MBU1387605.1 epoxyqueuosine reductase [Pseudomonadota bacterium]MBU1544196.1 epoxyqueuosine reductase [Pseudomonadota bacterium]MBU2431584.1 epoxyqueuosine reductase [Pseudomonadota bacterium]
MTKDQISNMIRDFIQNSVLNALHNENNDPAWDDFLVGFASGADPLWQQYKEYVGAFHWTPWEVFNQHCPDKNVSAEQLTVISWILPQREQVRKLNAEAQIFPDEAWARVRVYGEAFNIALRKHLVEKFEASKIAAVAPMLVPNWTVVKSSRFSYASSWSERHAAHAAGLGTFGLCDGLITQKGKAMRAGSVVVNLKLEPTVRTYSSHQAYCLFYAQGTCKKCMERCPVQAISEKGHDKEKCRQHLVQSAAYVKKTFGFDGYGCGLCQVGVPCEHMIPVKAARLALEKGEPPAPRPPIA